EPGDSQIEIKVRRTSRLRPETANRFDGCPTVKHDSRCPNVVVAKKPKIVILLDWKLRRRLEQGTVGPDDSYVTIGESARRKPLKRSNSDLEGMRQQPIVSVEKEEIGAAARPVASVSSRRSPSILLENVMDPREGLGNLTS